MNDATFTVTFKGQLPKLLAPGEVVRVTGKATVTSVVLDVVDVSSMTKSAYALGLADVKLVGTDLGIERS